MFFLIKLNHPAHYHLFKNFRNEMLLRGHKVIFIMKEKEILSQLLKSEQVEFYKLFDFKYSKDNFFSIVGSNIAELINSDLELYKFIKSNRPDFLLGTDAPIAHIGRLTGIPSFVFNEDDIQINKLFCYSAYPFATNIISPFVCDVGIFKNKKISYMGYQKLAYLHPNRFIPDRDRLNDEFKDGKRKFLLRMVSFTAGHDIEQSHSGINENLLDEIINKLRNFGDVYISSEKSIPDRYSEFKLDINIKEIHNYLSACDLFISDSQSMTVESCMLGTPSIRFNSFVGKISVLNELENKYQLTSSFNVNDRQSFLKKLDELLSIKDLKRIYNNRRDEMLRDKIDLTSFLIWFVENYPDSVHKLKVNPEIQYQFK